MRNIHATMIVLLFSSATAASEESSNPRQYISTYDCSFAKVMAVGIACEDDDKDEGNCPNLSMAYSENISFVTKDKTTPLDMLTKQFPSSPKVDSTRLYVLSTVQCHTNNEITIFYWGGGNCRSVCEVAVRYKLNEVGAVTKKSLIEDHRDLLPVVNEYGPFDKDKYTVWPNEFVISRESIEKSKPKGVVITSINVINKGARITAFMSLNATLPTFLHQLEKAGATNVQLLNIKPFTACGKSRFVRAEFEIDGNTSQLVELSSSREQLDLLLGTYDIDTQCISSDWLIVE